MSIPQIGIVFAILRNMLRKLILREMGIYD